MDRHLSELFNRVSIATGQTQAANKRTFTNLLSRAHPFPQALLFFR